MSNGLNLSYYNFKLDRPTKKELLIYNTRTGSIIKFEKEDYAIIKEIINNLNDIDENNVYLKTLKENGFITAFDFDELKAVKNMYLAGSKRENFISLTLLPAEHCNFACPYCFIYTYREKRMDKSTYDAIYNYIFDKVKDYKGEEQFTLRINWFGGEPTLEIDNILKFSTRILSLQEKFGLYYQSSMITNGYLMNYNNFELLTNAGILHYQFTFDGDQKFHNKVRYLKGKQPTFDVIFNNIKYIKRYSNANKDFRLDIRINFLKPTVPSVYDLIDKLGEVIQQDVRFNIYCRPVYDFPTSRDTNELLSNDYMGREEGIRQQMDFQFYIDKVLMKEKNEIRISNPLPEPTIGWCSSEINNSFIIGADRSIFTCDTNIDDKFSIGQIDKDGQIQINENSEWRKPLYEMENVRVCLECRLLPICQGGCRRVRLTDNALPCFWTDELIQENMEKYLDTV
jgi:uncharacterized protein